MTALAGVATGGSIAAAAAEKVPYLQNGKFDFDTPYDRLGSNCTKWDLQVERFGEDLEVAIGDLVLTEVLQGFRADKDCRQARKLLLSLTIVNMLDTAIALKAAVYFRILRKKGITVRKTIDIIIATYCIENKLPLLHSDKDFQPFHKYLKLKNAVAGN